jgi:perosamine synthetase
MSNIEVMSMSFEPGAVSSSDVIPLSVPEIRGNEWKYVKECLDTNWVSSAGPFVDRFEKQLAGYVGTNYAVAVVNGTAALHLALIIAGIKPGDEVLVPALTFVAPINAVSYVGGTPVFIDVEPKHWQIDTNKLEQFLRAECTLVDGELKNRATGRRVRAILPVHVLGHPCDMDSILELARLFDLKIIEDATESLGARYKGRMVGSDGDVACFSFNGNKVITTGGGGMLVTNDREVAEKARYLSTQAKDNPIEYIHEHVGYNYRLTNIQAAIGCAQMELLDSYIETKRRIFATYNDAFAEMGGVEFQKESHNAFSICWISTATIDPSRFPCNSRALIGHLANRKIQTRPLWHPVYSLRPYASCQSYKVEVADFLYERAVSLPSSVGLTIEQQQRVIEGVKSVLT